MHRDPVHAVANFGGSVWDSIGLQSAVDRFPGFTGIIGSEGARRRDRDEYSVRMIRIQKYGVQAHATSAWLPARSRTVAAQSGKFVPRLRTVSRTEQRCVLNTGIDCIWVCERWFEMPYALEFPGMLRPVIPLVRGERLAVLGRSVVHEFVALARRHPVRCCRHAPSGGFPCLT